jgi:threonine/homoserine/homoserine lactone efflux protein
VPTELIAVLPGFLLAVLLISASPGPAVAVILRRSATLGGRAALPLVAGIEAGLFTWAVLAAVGLSALLAVSEVAYTVLKVVGAGFLIVLGALALREAVREHRRAKDAGSPGWRDPADESPVVRRGILPALDGRPVPGPRRLFAEGMATNLANPKAAIFMIAFFPQFIPTGYPVLPTTLALAALQVTVEFTLYALLALGVGRARRVFTRPRVRVALEGASGTVLIGLGLRVATQP